MIDYFIYVTCHNTVAEGGKRKTHIYADGKGLMCGRKMMGLPTAIMEPEWLIQPDPDGEVCITCRRYTAKALLKELEQEQDESDD